MNDEKRHSSPEEHHRILMQDNEESEELTLKLTLVVSYKLHGMAADDMRRQLESMVDHAIGNGLLSGDSPAETTSYTGRVEEIDAVLRKEGEA